MRDAIARRGLMLVVSSPSGAGKSTLARRLLESDPLISMSVSVTTRPKRVNEVDGQDYFFVSRERFEDMVREGACLEHATVFGNRYGTPAGPVERLLGEGRDVLFDIDWQGAQQLTAKAKGDLVRVFILPPSRRSWSVACT
jgi:guanylate kinase